MQVNFTDKNFGAVELEWHSTGVAKAQTKLAKVADGVDLTLNGDIAGSLSVEATYAKDSVSVLAKVSHCLNKSSTGLALSAVLEVDGVSIGGQLDLDAANPTAPKDYNVGAQYTQKDLTASLVTSNQGNDITASYYQSISSDLVLGSSMLVKPDVGTRLFTFGGAYTLDKATSVKAMADSNGIHNSSAPCCTVTQLNCCTVFCHRHR